MSLLATYPRDKDVGAWRGVEAEQDALSLGGGCGLRAGLYIREVGETLPMGRLLETLA